MSEAEVTQAEFVAYELVRQSGATNMLDEWAVAALSGLTRDRVAAVRRNYREARAKWGRTDG